jgi:hypothetical protein
VTDDWKPHHGVHVTLPSRLEVRLDTLTSLQHQFHSLLLLLESVGPDVQEQWANEGVKALQDIQSRVTSHRALLSLPASQPFKGPSRASFLQQKKAHSRTSTRAMTSAEMIDRIEAIRDKADADRAKDHEAVKHRAQIETTVCTDDLQMDVSSDKESEGYGQEDSQEGSQEGNQEDDVWTGFSDLNNDDLLKVLDTSLCTPLPERLISQGDALSSPLLPHILSPPSDPTTSNFMPSNSTPKRPRDSTIGLTMSAALVTGRRVKTRLNYAALASGGFMPVDE